MIKDNTWGGGRLILIIFVLKVDINIFKDNSVDWKGNKINVMAIMNIVLGI